MIQHVGRKIKKSPKSKHICKHSDQNGSWVTVFVFFLVCQHDAWGKCEEVNEGEKK